MSKLPADLWSVTSDGLKLVRPVFRVHYIDAAGEPVATRALRRREPMALGQKQFGEVKTDKGGGAGHEYLALPENRQLGSRPVAPSSTAIGGLASPLPAGASEMSRK